MKNYHMLVENRDGVRKEYVSPHQGAAPAGWKCIAVMGYSETPKPERYGSKINETNFGREEESQED